MTKTHFVQSAGNQTRAITTIAAANKKRQKQIFIFLLLHYKIEINILNGR